MSERELIERVLAGDGRAERALYDAHVERVYRLCWRLADGDGDRAQDFTQETFVRAFERLGEFRGESRLSTWLHAIAVSVSLNGMRQVRRRRERESPLDESVAAQPAVRAEPDLRQRLKAAVAALPEHYRVVFTMYDMEGYTHEEIGSALSLPVGTSKARLSRARAQLRAALSAYAGEWA